MSVKSVMKSILEFVQECDEIEFEKYEFLVKYFSKYWYIFW